MIAVSSTTNTDRTDASTWRFRPYLTDQAGTMSGEDNKITYTGGDFARENIVEEYLLLEDCDEAKEARLVRSSEATEVAARGHCRQSVLRILREPLVVRRPSLRRTATGCRNWRRAV